MPFIRATKGMKSAWALGELCSEDDAGPTTHKVNTSTSPPDYYSLAKAGGITLEFGPLLASSSMAGIPSANESCPAVSVTHRKTWSAEEDSLLIKYIKTHGEGRWTSLPKKAGLKRRGKSCRLRWFNYLHPNIKRGNFSEDEEELIIRLHRLLGNRWSLIAKRLPGRTDNDVKNYWNTHLCKKLKDNAATSTFQSPLESTGTKENYWNTITQKVENTNGVAATNGENIEMVETCENQTPSGFCEVGKIITCMEEEEPNHQLQHLQSNEEWLSLCKHFPCGQVSQHDVLLVGADPDMNNLFYPDNLSLMLSDDFCNYGENL